MKKSLNNVFKGKRLVTGDENEMTQYEILLKEEDDKVVMKERGTDGTIQEIGSSESSSNLWYYVRGSKDGKSYTRDNGSEKFTNLKDFFFSWPSSGSKETIMDAYKEAVLSVSKDFNLSEDNVVIEESNPYGAHYELDINVKKAKGLYISLFNDMVDIITISLDYYLLPSGSHSMYCEWNFKYRDSNDADKMNTSIPQWIYDAESNILLYYANFSSLDLRISPSYLGESLKVYPYQLRDKITLINGGEFITESNVGHSIQ